MERQSSSNSDEHQKTKQGRELDRLYQQLQLKAQDGKNCQEHDRCSSSCLWEEAHITPPTGAYVGEHYDKHRLLFIGINTNWGSKDSEGFYSVYNWISGQNSQTSKYVDGAIHRLVQKKYGISNLSWQKSKTLFAFTNLIKCSVNTRAGHPTTPMIQNCSVREEILFKEISILKPSTIITLGNLPFEAICSHYANTAKPICPHFKDWLFSFSLATHRTTVIRLYNPGQGYRNIRSVWKSIRSMTSVSDSWNRFMPEHLSGDELRTYIEGFSNPNQRVDTTNPFYDMVIEKLLSLAKNKSRKRR